MKNNIYLVVKILHAFSIQNNFIYYIYYNFIFIIIFYFLIEYHCKIK